MRVFLQCEMHWLKINGGIVRRFDAACPACGLLIRWSAGIRRRDGDATELRDL